jgi:hypothetical protein
MPTGTGTNWGEMTFTGSATIAPITKTRFIELTRLAMEVYKNMQSLGIKQEEYCCFGDIMRNLLGFPD